MRAVSSPTDGPRPVTPLPTAHADEHERVHGGRSGRYGDPIGGLPADNGVGVREWPAWATEILAWARAAEREAVAQSDAYEAAEAHVAEVWHALPPEARAAAGRRPHRVARAAFVAREFTRGRADMLAWWAVYVPTLCVSQARLAAEGWTWTLLRHARAAEARVAAEERDGRPARAAGRRRASAEVEAHLHARTGSLAARHVQATRARAPEAAG